MTTLKTIILIFILLLVGAAYYIHSGSYNIAAKVPHNQLSEWVLHNIKEYSIRNHAKDIKRPKLGDETQVEEGFEHYNNTCSGCHGTPGTDPAKGFNPSPPKLVDASEEMSAEELFWVTKNGIKMTAMPAISEDHNDEDIWSIVAFLKRLPDITPEEYEAMIETTSVNNDDHSH